MRYELKRIAIWPFIKVSFFVNLLVGFVFGLFYSPIVSVIMVLLTATPYLGSPEIVAAPSWGMLLLIIPFVSAFLAGCVNTLVGLFLVLAYNMFAVLVGGFEFELDLTRKDAVSPPSQPVQPTVNPTIYAAGGSAIPPPPPPPGWQSATAEPQRTNPPLSPDQDWTDRLRKPLTSEPSDDMLSESGEPSEPFSAESDADRPEDTDNEGNRA